MFALKGKVRHIMGWLGIVAAGVALASTPSHAQRQPSAAEVAEAALQSGDEDAARAALLSIADQPDGFRRQMALADIHSETITLGFDSELARGARFSRLAFETLVKTPVGSDPQFLPIANDHAKYCAILSDLACLEAASAQAVSLIDGLPEDPESDQRDAFNWRAAALILAGRVEEAKRYLAAASYGSPPKAPDEFADRIENVVVVYSLSDEFTVQLRRAAIDFMDAQTRREKHWITSRIATNLGTSYLVQRRFAEAEEAYRLAYDLALANYDRDAIGTVESARDLALAMDLRGRVDLAMPIWRSNYEIAVAAGTWSPDYGTEVSDWVRGLIKTGRLGEAIDAAKAAWEGGLAEKEETEKRVLLGYGLAYGTALLEAGLHARAEEVLGEASAYWFRDTPFGGPRIAPTLARTIEAQGDWERAEAVRRAVLDYAAEDVFAGPFNRGLIRARLALAVNLSMQGKADEAETLFTAQLQAARDGKDPARALEADVALEYAAHLERLGRAGEAVDLAALALDIRALQLERVGEGAGESAVLAAASAQRRAARLLLAAYLGKSVRDAADGEALFEAAQRADANPAALALSTKAAASVARSAGAAAEIERWQAAQRRIEAIDARLLVLEGQGARGEKPKARAYKEREAALETLKRAETALEQSFPRFFDLARPEPASLEAVRAALEPGEVVIVLVPGTGEARGGPTPTENGGTVIALSRDDLAAAPIALGTEELSRAIAALHEGLADRGSGRTYHPDYFLPEVIYPRATAYQLYRALFADRGIQSVIGGAQRWTIVPQGELLSVSFEALVTAPPEGGEEGDIDPDTLRATRWLGIERAIAVAPSVQSITLARSLGDGSADGGPRAPFLGIGDPAFSGREDPPVAVPEDLQERTLLAAVRAPEAASAYFRGEVANLEELSRLSRLPGTALELRALAQILGASEDSVVTQLGATEAKLAELDAQGRLSDTEIVVFATHGLIGGELDAGLAEPALALTPPPGASQETLEPGNDGLLTASEAAVLRLSADWLILSACNTAAGSGRNAQGLSGLARAFLYAGAKSLLVSHFPVSDRATPVLTSTAINLYRETGRGRAEALREARARMLASEQDDDKGASLAHPKAWAALTLIAPGR